MPCGKTVQERTGQKIGTTTEEPIKARRRLQRRSWTSSISSKGTVTTVVVLGTLRENAQVTESLEEKERAKTKEESPRAVTLVNQKVDQREELKEAARQVARAEASHNQAKAKEDRVGPAGLRSIIHMTAHRQRKVDTAARRSL